MNTLRSSGLLALLAIAAVALSTNAFAVDAEAAQALAKRNTCFRCHGIDKDKDGPAWKSTKASPAPKKS